MSTEADIGDALMWVSYIELLVCVEDVPQTPEVQTQISAVTPTGAEMWLAEEDSGEGAEVNQMCSSWERK